MTTRPPLLQAILPPFDQFDANTFHYPELRKVVEKYYADEYQEVTDKLEAFSSETAEAAFLQDYLPVLAQKIQEAQTDDDRILWSQKYTEMSVAIFGRPNLGEAVRQARRDLELFRDITERHPDVSEDAMRPLFAMYEKFVNVHVDESGADTPWDESELLTELRAYLYEKYSDVYSALGAYDDGMNLDVQTIKEAYDAMLEKMTRFSPIWKKWKVVIVESAQMAVSPGVKHIKLGRHMPPLSAARVKSLFTHEVLVHAQRSVRGLAYDHYLGYGLPGYVVAEEGLGVLMEAAIEGAVPYRAGDRYIDIAMALGSDKMDPVNRHQLLKVVEARTILRKLDEDAPFTDRQLKDLVTQHVARIYRGTLGNEIVGVFTKDVVYYRGYRLMADYLCRYEGKDLRRAVDFVLSSKINPVDPLHRSYIHDQKFNIIRAESR